MKKLIKQLASEQQELKKARKTGTMPKPLPMKWRLLDIGKLPEKIQHAIYAANKAYDNKPKITAALNLHHEIRGSTHRHDVPKDSHYQYLYTRAYEELKNKVH